ncbi:hypothetical protein ACIQX3_21335 [Peribacillus frigoritolerans]
MNFAVLLNGTHYLLREDGAYAIYDTEEKAEELALDYSDMDAEVIALV